ncbi:MAG: hypothetical protein GJ680_05215 [Alteromonadaceae bacterium]|nr:hypothetical protein [Alteromonadaceae bacterium]
MDDLDEETGKGLFRLLKWIVIDIFIETAVYWYGRLFLNIISFGRYPQQNDEAETRCILAGVVAITLTIALIIYLEQGEL